MKYIGNCNKSVTCIYGSFNIKEGEDVPMLIGIKFPQYCNQVKETIPEIPTQRTIVIEEEMTETTKNERKSK